MIRHLYHKLLPCTKNKSNKPIVQKINFKTHLTMQKHFLISAVLVCCGWFYSCSEKNNFDAAGNFEADEIIVSAQQNGILLAFDITEGQKLEPNQTVGQIDVETQKLQKAQTEATLSALHQKTATPDAQTNLVRKQLAAQQAQLDQLQREKKRTQNLVNDGAAPSKQLDDINSAITILERQMDATRSQIALYESNTATQNRSILSESTPIAKSAAVLQNQIEKGQIINPIAGVVLTKYAMQGEMAMVGKPLYKIANVDTLNLKAYVTGKQLPQIKLGQTVTVRIDDGKGGYKNYSGTISWVADKSEFTPKTIQTKDERENLVYAIKVRVQNDGFLKIGMYAEMVQGSFEGK
jgi:HlyD family secretion protein